MENRKKKLERIDREFIGRGAESIRRQDVEDLCEKEAQLMDKVKKSGRLKRYVDDIFTLVSLLGDFIRRRYRAVPYRVIAASAFALIYILNPIDLIPDVIPGVGMLDDVAVLTLCLALVRDDLSVYRQWKTQQ